MAKKSAAGVTGEVSKPANVSNTTKAQTTTAQKTENRITETKSATCFVPVLPTEADQLEPEKVEALAKDAVRTNPKDRSAESDEIEVAVPRALEGSVPRSSQREDLQLSSSPTGESKPGDDELPWDGFTDHIPDSPTGGTNVNGPDSIFNHSIQHYMPFSDGQLDIQLIQPKTHAPAEKSQAVINKPREQAIMQQQETDVGSDDERAPEVQDSQDMLL